MNNNCEALYSGKFRLITLAMRLSQLFKPVTAQARVQRSCVAGPRYRGK